MKMMRKVLSLVLVFAAIAVLAVPVFARAIPVGYGVMTQSTEQKGAQLTSRVTITENNDGGKLRIKQEVQSGSYKYPEKSGESLRGALTYSYTQTLFSIAGYPPNCVYVAYEVYDGSECDAFARYEYHEIDASVI